MNINMLYRSFFIILILLQVTISCVVENDTLMEVSLEKVESDDGKVPLADPFIMAYDGAYYAYGTTGNRDFYTYVSSDLKYWEKYETPVLDSEDSYGEKWFWAPEVYYYEELQVFKMFYSAATMLCEASSNSPLGPFAQARKTPMWNDRGIDPTLFVDGDKKYLCYDWLSDRSTINIVQEKNGIFDFNSVASVMKPDSDWENFTTEGPTIVKVKDKYIMTYAGGDYTLADYGIGVAVADDPMGPWEKYEGNPVMQFPKYKGTVLQGTGHNSLFKDLEGNWRMVFHAHSAKGIEGGRYMYIVSCELQDTPPYIKFKDDIFPARLISERPE